jgi:hypothetical protein
LFVCGTARYLTTVFCNILLLRLQSAATAAVEAAQRIAADGRERVLVYVASDEVDEAMGYMSSAITGSVGGDSRLSVLNSEHVREFFESHGGDTSLLPMVRHTLSSFYHVPASAIVSHVTLTCQFTAIHALNADRQIKRAPKAPLLPHTSTCRWTSSS